ncbi:PEP-CTERM sorting domain-containing protein [Nitrosovibrio sp. Nv17]|uniref:PEP-CTERM sorting domain-containing protein n=1 Tax=Nitrosovibrio sp. Nv17 TaxID=1855339 RepID=UPI000908B822|nr:PEP-CTERM sorting domain-containing protein [Nitrosovibrio sp. Nv17]SFW13799.1 PEP-CTERM protein-sorting domain-containing protein [Nitrosovibrio sp. Nv17]
MMKTLHARMALCAAALGLASAAPAIAAVEDADTVFQPGVSVTTSPYFFAPAANTVRGYAGDNRPVLRVSTDNPPNPFGFTGAETIYLAFDQDFSTFTGPVSAILTVTSVAGGQGYDASAANPFTVSAHGVDANPLTSITDDTNPGGTIHWRDFYSNNILAADSAAHTVIDGFGTYTFDVSAVVNSWISGANDVQVLALTGKNDLSGNDFLHGFSNNTEVPGATFLTISPVPEPGEWAMLLAGLGVLAWRLRRTASTEPATPQIA